MSYPALAPASRLPVSGYVTYSGPTGEVFEHAVSSRTSPDGQFRFVWTLAAGRTGPGLHFHEDETESFEIVSGVLRIWIDEVARDYAPGDTVTVAPRVPHRFLNPGTTPVVVNVSLTGPRMEDCLVPIAVVSKGRKPTLGELLRMFAGFDVYRGSTGGRAGERWGLAVVALLLRLLRVRAFEPALGWDRRPEAG